jgi:4-amino-4-deoxy-L-arabinose transferase-like glycosyltransferase
MSFLDTIEKRPRDAAFLYIIAQVVIWTLVPFYIAISLPLDVVSDGLGWGHEWQLGYFKHPPLPSWLAEMSFDALGDIGPFLLSQLAIAVTCLFVFALGREIFGERKAAIGTVLLAGVWYFSVPGAEWNHNVAQMPAWAAITYLFYKALRDGAMRWWLLLGFAAGIGLMMKYSTAVLMAVMFLYLMSSRKGRARFLTAGPYIALAVCVATISPHLWWLQQNDYPTLHYAAERAGHEGGFVSRILLPLKFLFTQFTDLIPAILLAALAGLFGRNMARVPASIDDDGGFLLAMGLGPAVLTALLSLIAGLGLRAMWGTPMWNLTGLIIVYFVGARADRASFVRLGIGTLALLVIMPLIYWFTTSYGPEQRGHVARSAWPDKTMAHSFDQQYQLLTGQPVQIVAGDGWLAGLIAMRGNPRASVFTDGDTKQAPWITPQRLSKEGALVVWRIEKGNGAPPPGLAALPHFKDIGVMQFSWPRARKAPMLTVGWGIVPPQNPPL